MHFVIIPGINGSDQDHWQSAWQSEWGSSASRISPSSWDRPELDDWCLAIDRAVTAVRPARTMLVAHSLGALAAAHWATRRERDVAGLFLVALPDPVGPNFPAEAPTFAGVVPAPLAVPRLMVTSDDDPYCAPDAALRLAAGWNLDRVGIGPAGHINSASRLGSWGVGRALLTAFAAGVRGKPA